VRYAMTVDLQRCIGCSACAVACKAENEVPDGVARLVVRKVQTDAYPASRIKPLPVMCSHCEAAPCIPVCPTGALARRPDGIVDLNKSKCIACGACMPACPFDALFFNPVTKTADKCSFCAHRVDDGLLPACVPVCPTDAIGFLDTDDARDRAELARKGAAATRHPDRGAEPQVFYTGGDETLLSGRAGSSLPAWGPGGPLRAHHGTHRPHGG